MAYAVGLGAHGAPALAGDGALRGRSHSTRMPTLIAAECCRFLIERAAHHEALAPQLRRLVHLLVDENDAREGVDPLRDANAPARNELARADSMTTVIPHQISDIGLQLPNPFGTTTPLTLAALSCSITNPSSGSTP